MDNNEIPKYKKKTKSNTSKSKEKAKHKHEYSEECLLINNKRPYLATYCSICGKIKNWKAPTCITETGVFKLMSDAEVFEKYKDLKIIEVEDLWNKFVTKTV